MIARGRSLKFTAVIALVVLALTGFSKGRHHSSSRHGSGGGGGCSSSSQDHDSSSSSTSGGGSYDSSYDDDDDDSYGSSGSSGSSSGGSSYTRRPTYRSTPTSSSTGNSSTLDGTAKLLSCATEKKPYATVEVSNPNGREVDYWVDVTFKDAQNNELVQKTADVEVPAKGRATVKVHLYSSLIDQVDHCEVDPEVYGS
ncbi:hypothetical protein ACFY1L_23915 [Streptomyces sp. NPDC001663]|uniref:hypothetical protein n=1 Tax=Streptomyces sp. NPDC001663 TaxID=3364597 RepID=UPI0036B5CCAE